MLGKTIPVLLPSGRSLLNGVVMEYVFAILLAEICFWMGFGLCAILASGKRSDEPMEYPHA